MNDFKIGNTWAGIILRKNMFLIHLAPFHLGVIGTPYSLSIEVIIWKISLRFKISRTFKYE